MVSSGLTDTRVAVDHGVALLEATEVHKENNIQVAASTLNTTVEKKGLYRFDADRSAVSVFDGKAKVAEGDSAVEVGKGKQVIASNPGLLAKPKNSIVTKLATPTSFTSGAISGRSTCSEEAPRPRNGLCSNQAVGSAPAGTGIRGSAPTRGFPRATRSTARSVTASTLHGAAGRRFTPSRDIARILCILIADFERPSLFGHYGIGSSRFGGGVGHMGGRR